MLTSLDDEEYKLDFLKIFNVILVFSRTICLEWLLIILIQTEIGKLSTKQVKYILSDRKSRCY